MTLCRVIDLSQLINYEYYNTFSKYYGNFFFKNHSPFLSRLFITKQMLTEAEGNIDYINPLETKNCSPLGVRNISPLGRLNTCNQCYSQPNSIFV